MMRKKTAIVTMYHNNVNYGANLQAYALVKICNDMGYDTEVIDFYDGSKVRYVASSFKRFINSFAKRKELKDRDKAVKGFRDSIKHSKLYCLPDIKKANEFYNCFIVGSDQVWNPDWINEAYKLSFVGNKNYKFSYAASLGRKQLNENEKELFGSMLKSFNAVSVREKSSVDLLSDLYGDKIEWVLDPTLLLDKTEWDRMSERDCKAYGDYMFCYFLGDDLNARSLAVGYAKKHNLKIVTIPDMSGKSRDCDLDFGDEKVYNVSPEVFVSLIKNSKVVFTDSFHATVFSHIFEKEFFVFNQKSSEMVERMVTLCSLFKTEDRIIYKDEQFSEEYLEKPVKIDYSAGKETFNKMKEISLTFLEENLKKAENNV